MHKVFSTLLRPSRTCKVPVTDPGSPGRLAERESGLILALPCLPYGAHHRGGLQGKGEEVFEGLLSPVNLNDVFC